MRYVMAQKSDEVRKIDGAKDKGDGNFTVAEDGTYTIKWFFNKVDASLEVVKN